MEVMERLRLFGASRTCKAASYALRGSAWLASTPRPKRILTQAHMQGQMEAVLDRSRLVDGKQTSLAEHGT